ncbi:hypothetical protein L227DRAFT_571373 [Lentinus tigrinus ALCF2SS1-6]|uniref:F-box domain-containing protein n=1 Tax=Lentinus tigrinus ALCF2SS1-6 TaxID=1328759 RepID=A0A5C2SNQ1_9APHY|nr:hypothetical protein L227DRAFT_571373 [Lentinus tigrinus ALCF2SS1-6]
MSSPSANAASWHALPAEMKLSIVDQLDLDAVRAFAKVNHESYTMSIPTLFRSVHITNADALQQYATHVPKIYLRHIRQLTICTKRAKQPPCGSSQPARVTDALCDILPHCEQLEQLTLSLAASPAKAVIPCFQQLRELTSLCIDHCGDEARSPLSERLVVSIAATVPNLRHLSLDRITRSALHAPDLVGARPFVPVVKGDEDIPDHPLLGRELRLPSLLRLPTLKKLRIRDTHLGDPQWECVPVYCSLEVLDLGSCYHESNDYNRICTERIMGNIGHTVDECALNTALTSQTFAHAKHSDKPLKKLRKVHLTPLFPVENVVDTLTTLSDSPVESLSVQCHEDDVVDMCSALEDFLNIRAERGEKGFYEHLNEITVTTVSDLADALDIGVGGKKRAPEVLTGEGADAVKRLQEFCRDLRLGAFAKEPEVPVVKPTTVNGRGRSASAPAVLQF